MKDGRMFEQKRQYPAAITQNGAKDPSGAQQVAIEWVLRKRVEVGGTVLLFVPQKGSLARNDSAISRLSTRPGIAVDTWRGGVSGWAGGPVLAAWPSRDKLAEIADDGRTRALCVIPWLDKDTVAWERAVIPERLDGSEPPAAASQLDPVVIVGLTHLSHSVNHGNNLAGPLDHRDAVAVLRTLHKGGFALPADDVYAWALAHGWPARGAERLRELSARIGAGRIVQLKGSSPLRADVLDFWRAEATQATAGLEREGED